MISKNESNNKNHMTKIFNTISAHGVQCFEGADSFITSIRVLELAKALGLEVKEQQAGLHWIAFVNAGETLANISFYKPSHAYAFLLGVKAMKEQL
jgi:hypothetical protein